MTVIAISLPGNKAKNQKEPLVVDEPSKKVPKVDVESGVKPRLVILGPRIKRVSTAATICLFLTALLVMSMGIIGGMYLYRQLARSQMRFHGWCTIPYQNMARQESLISDMDFDNRDASHISFGYDKENAGQLDGMGMESSFKQEFEIDLESESFEKIVVPDFGRGRRGKFIHDFKTNKTGIIDLNGGRCFVMPLNRQRVLAPRSMYDLVVKMYRGYYKVDTEIVRETMRVVIPPITDFTGIGQFITQECSNLKTYLLEKVEDDGISKRSVPTSEAIFAEFAGQKINELFIDTSPLDEYEKPAAQV